MLKKWDGRMCTGPIWLQQETSGWAFGNTVIDFGVHKVQGISRLADELWAFKAGLRPHGVSSLVNDAGNYFPFNTA